MSLISENFMTIALSKRVRHLAVTRSLLTIFFSWLGARPLRRPPADHPHPDRHLVSQAGKAELRLRLGDAGQLEQDRPFLHHRHPVVRLPLTLAHAGFERAGSDRLVRENPDV